MEMSPPSAPRAAHLPLDDRMALHDIYALSTRLIEAQDGAGWAALLCPRRRVRAAEPAGGDGPLGAHRGNHRAGPLRGWLSRAERGIGAPLPDRRRPRGIGADEADGSCALMIVNGGAAGGPRILGIAVYEDRFVRTGDGWNILRRLAIPEGAPGPSS